jgi:hypothetical protein
MDGSLKAGATVVDKKLSRGMRASSWARVRTRPLSIIAVLTAGRFVKIPRSRANSARGGPDEEAMIELALLGALLHGTYFGFPAISCSRRN